jgi:hypothetical protein
MQRRASLQQGDSVNTTTLIVIVVGILFLGLIWRVVKGVIRLVITVGVVLLIIYLLMNAGLTP